MPLISFFTNSIASVCLLIAVHVHLAKVRFTLITFRSFSLISSTSYFATVAPTKKAPYGAKVQCLAMTLINYDQKETKVNATSSRPNKAGNPQTTVYFLQTCGTQVDCSLPVHSKNIPKAVWLTLHLLFLGHRQPVREPLFIINDTNGSRSLLTRRMVTAPRHLPICPRASLPTGTRRGLLWSVATVWLVRENRSGVWPKITNTRNTAKGKPNKVHQIKNS